MSTLRFSVAMRYCACLTSAVSGSADPLSPEAQIAMQGGHDAGIGLSAMRPLSLVVQKYNPAFTCAQERFIQLIGQVFVFLWTCPTDRDDVHVFRYRPLECLFAIS